MGHYLNRPRVPVPPKPLTNVSYPETPNPDTPPPPPVEEQAELTTEEECSPEDSLCIFINSLLAGINEEGDNTEENMPLVSEDMDKDPAVDYNDEVDSQDINPFVISVVEGDEIIPESEANMSHDVYKHLVKSYKSHKKMGKKHYSSKKIKIKF